MNEAKNFTNLKRNQNLCKNVSAQLNMHPNSNNIYYKERGVVCVYAIKHAELLLYERTCIEVHVVYYTYIQYTYISMYIYMAIWAH